MKIAIKYFASMRDSMGKSDESVDLDSNATVEDLWGKVSENSLPDNTLIAVNMEYTNIGHVLKDGDEVAFFPPVTGG